MARVTGCEMFHKNERDERPEGQSIVSSFCYGGKMYLIHNERAFGE